MEEITFEKLPQAVKTLIKEVGELKEILTNQRQNNTQEPQEKLLSVSETAIFLNLTVPTIYSKVSRGDLPYMKRGKRLYFSQIELLNYIKQGKVKSNAQVNDEVNKYFE